ncbi:MAG: D-glycerate dehydrogenase [bacterium]|nr:D-glycerate dehydrogenase [bacterium]
MAKIYVTRNIPGTGLPSLREKGHTIVVSEKDGVLTKEELIADLKKDSYDGVLSLLTDKIDAEIFDAAPDAKIFANYAVGFNNFDLDEAKKRGVVVTNTPGDLTDSVAEHTFGLIIALSHRIAEGDRFVRAGKYEGWNPNLLIGSEIKGKTLGLLGAGRIGARVIYCARAFDMNVLYYDVVRNKEVEKNYGAKFFETPEEVLTTSDFVSVHVPLLDSTHHLINRERLVLMKKTAYLINTSRGPVVDEAALVEALKKGIIAGAGLDVYENEPKLAEGLSELQNVILTPHIASATEYAREEMSRLAADNLIAFFEGKEPPNAVK